jgi:hypothetical protein
MADSDDDVITFSSASGLAGTTWTPELHIVSAITENNTTTTPSTALVISEGQLQVKMAIRQKSTNPGFLATYALFNEAGGESATQLGADINLVKDQFLKRASYVVWTTNGNNNYEYLEVGKTDVTGAAATVAGWYQDGIISNGVATEFSKGKNEGTRALKLEFALNKEDADPETPGDTATDTDSVIYIDVNELFDSYTGYSGVDVNQDENIISGVINSTGNEARKSGTGTYLNLSTGITTGAIKPGFYISGIQDDIKAYIQDLGNVQSDANYKFLTGFGVNTDGQLTAAFAQASAQYVSFSGITAVAGKTDTARVAVTGDNVDAALNSISNTIAKLDYTYNGTTTTYGSTPELSGEDNDRETGDTRTYYIYAITETDGQIATSAKPLNGNDLRVTAFASDPLSGTNKKIYTISDTGSGNGSLQSGLETIVSSVYQEFAALDLTQIGSGATLSSYRVDASTQAPYGIVNAVSQEDGLVYATGLALDANNVTFAGISNTTSAGIALTGIVENNTGTAVTVGAALSSIAAYIAQSDLATVGQVAGTPGNVNNTDGTIYKVINQVSQTDGRVAATTMDLTAGNVAATEVAAVLPTTSNATVDPTLARVAVDGTNVAKQIDDISNTIADYMSFHDADGNVI